MTTTKQLNANRRNARKSTGPRTEVGKEISSRNAVRHGLTAEQHFVVGEDHQAFKDLRSALQDQLQPATAMEDFMTDRIATIAWRLTRIPAIEASVIEALSQPPRPSPLNAPGSETRRRTRGRPPRPATAQDGPPLSLTIGQAFELALSTNILEKISRYDAALMAQLLRTEAALNRLVTDRKQQMFGGKAPPTPPDAPMSAEEGWKRIKLA